MSGFLKSLFGLAPGATGIYRLYDAIVEQARSRAFLVEVGGADTSTGRVALVAAHAFLAMDRRGRVTGRGTVSLPLFDEMFADMDRNLREMGIGDLSVGRRVKSLARYFYSMAAAYRDGLNRGDTVPRVAANDYLLGSAAPSPASVAAFCTYLRACVLELVDPTEDDIVCGRIRFAELRKGPDP